MAGDNAVQLTRPQVNISPDALETAGFSKSAIAQFKKTVEDYSTLLFDRALRYADLDRDPKLLRDITANHVKDAAKNIAGSFGKVPRSKWAIAGQVFEYVGTAIAAVAGNYLPRPEAIVAILVGSGLLVVLLVVRLSRSKE
jgi:hypothetical protein